MKHPLENSFDKISEDREIFRQWIMSLTITEYAIFKTIAEKAVKEEVEKVKNDCNIIASKTRYISKTMPQI